MTDRHKRLFVVIPGAVYLAGALVACGLLLGLADRWWPATVLAFAPRWPVLAPAVVLAAVAAHARAFRWALAHGAAALVVLVLYMDLELPSLGGDGESPPIMVATYNIGGASVNAPWVKRFIADSDAHIIALIECSDDDMGSEGHDRIGDYQARFSWGLCFLSRFPILAVDARDQTDAFEKGGNATIVRFELEAEGGAISVLVVHLETVREGLEALRYERLDGIPKMNENIALRRWESEMARAWSERSDLPLMVLGDFNMPVQSAIYRDNWSHLDNAFESCGSGYGSTKHTRWHGIRIDHVLTGGGLRCSAARVGDRGDSDHAPLFATLHLR